MLVLLLKIYRYNCIMPQIFQVLRCYKCLVFQVHQTKKSNKWECKLCGEKQSVKRHYGLGTAKDCRIHVQKLNGMRGEIDELKCNQDDEEDTENEHVSQFFSKTYSKVTASKWSNFVEPADINETREEKTNDDGMFLGDAEVVIELPKKRKKFNSTNIKKKANVRPSLQKVHSSNNDCDVTHTVYSGGQHIDTTNIDSSHCEHISKDLIVKEEPKHINKSITKKKIIPPVLNKNSKWAQFTDNTQETNEDYKELDNTPSAGVAMVNDLMFSLCDDDDWDNILNI